VTHRLVHEIKLGAIERIEGMDPFNTDETNAKIEALKPMVPVQKKIMEKQMEDYQKSSNGLRILEDEISSQKQNLAGAKVGKKMLDMMTFHYCQTHNLSKVDYCKDGNALLDHVARLLSVPVSADLT